jgi:hypothetical protein
MRKSFLVILTIVITSFTCFAVSKVPTTGMPFNSGSISVAIPGTALNQKNMVKKTNVWKKLKSNLQAKGHQVKSFFNKMMGGTKSKLAAILLCFFLGALGIHRFYLGYTGWGIAFLLTAGFLGIGVLVDFVRLLFGSLQPKNTAFDK